MHFLVIAGVPAEDVLFSTSRRRAPSETAKRREIGPAPTPGPLSVDQERPAGPTRTSRLFLWRPAEPLVRISPRGRAAPPCCGVSPSASSSRGPALSLPIPGGAPRRPMAVGRTGVAPPRRSGRGSPPRPGGGSMACNPESPCVGGPGSPRPARTAVLVRNLSYPPSSNSLTRGRGRASPGCTERFRARERPCAAPAARGGGPVPPVAPAVRSPGAVRLRRGRPIVTRRGPSALLRGPVDPRPRPIVRRLAAGRLVLRPRIEPPGGVGDVLAALAPPLGR